MDLPSSRPIGFRLVIPATTSLAHYEEFFTDANASANYGGPLTSGQSWSRLAHDRGIWHLRGYGVWLIETKHNGQVVGGCGFWQAPSWPRELTWWLLPDARGKGLAAEASQAAIDFAYQGFAWQTVQTYMADDNKPAQALAVRLGGREACRHTFPTGTSAHLPVPPTGRALP